MPVPSELILEEGRFIDDLNTTRSNRLSVVCTFVLIAALIGSLWTPWLLVPAGVCLMGLLLFNRDLYRFFREKRGARFAVMAILWHWIYFFYSGLTFAIGFLKYQRKKARRSRSAPAE